MKEIKSVSGINNKGGDSSLKRIGNFIKEARLSKNQSIEELASDLKIGAHQLEAIEEGNEEKLPEKVFIKAMIRRISQKLKLDTEFLMDEFKTERKEVKIEEIVEEVSKNNYKSNQSKNLSPHRIHFINSMWCQLPQFHLNHLHQYQLHLSRKQLVHQPT